MCRTGWPLSPPRALMTFTQIWPPWTIGAAVLPTGPPQLHMLAMTTGDFRPGSAGRPAPGVAWPPAPPAAGVVGAAAASTDRRRLKHLGNAVVVTACPPPGPKRPDPHAPRA